MRAIVLTMLYCFMLATTATANLLSAAAEQVSARFVRQIGLGDFEQAYAQASPLLRLANERHQRMTMMESYKIMLGKVEERLLTAVRSGTTFPNLPDGRLSVGAVHCLYSAHGGGEKDPSAEARQRLVAGL